MTSNLKPGTYSMTNGYAPGSCAHETQDYEVQAFGCGEFYGKPDKWAFTTIKNNPNLGIVHGQTSNAMVSTPGSSSVTVARYVPGMWAINPLQPWIVEQIGSTLYYWIKPENSPDQCVGIDTHSATPADGTPLIISACKDASGGVNTQFWLII